MVTIGSRTADVGCDHGFVSIYLYENKIAPKVYAMDLREGPLQRAREHIEEKGFSDYIETRLSDGLEALAAGEAETLICAGMGGRLMAEILSKGHEKAAMMRELILQPQSELWYFRWFLRQSGFVIVKEDIIKEDGKFYPIIKAVYSGGKAVSRDGKSGREEAVSRGSKSGREAFADCRSGEVQQRTADSFGPCLLADRHLVLKEYLEMLQERDVKILESLGSAKTDRRAMRRQELREELSDIAYCLALYEA